MAISSLPKWIEKLEDEDLAFIRHFILESGSLKKLAENYGVTYPTIRLRLDRLIEKIQVQEEESTPYIKLVKKLALDDKLDFDTAKLLINAYNNEKEDK